MKSWLNFFRKNPNRNAKRPRFAPKPLDELYAAIRRGDVEGVRSALEQGAPLDVCTFDNEGYHTPEELAEQRGQTKILELLRAAREQRGLSAPEILDET